MDRGLRVGVSDLAKKKKAGCLGNTANEQSVVFMRQWRNSICMQHLAIVEIMPQRDQCYALVMMGSYILRGFIFKYYQEKVKKHCDKPM